MEKFDRYKIKLCDFYKKDGKCNNKDKCTYAHGNNELRCMFDENCVNDNCKRIHVKRDNKININRKNEIILDNLTSDLKNILNVTQNKNNDNLENKIINIKKELYNKYMKLSRIDKNDWSNSIDVEDIEKEIKILELEYEKLKISNKKGSAIFDNDINLDSIFNINEDYEKDKDEYTIIPEIKLTINGINYYEDNHIQNNKKQELKEIINLIDNMENQFSSFNENIKQIINKEIKNNYLKFILLNNLNKIKTEINLFKSNYEDIIEF